MTRAPGSKPPSLPLATLMARALRLRCPRCGVSPVFPPLQATRTFKDYFSTLQGCPRCRYDYEREPGYFLMATFAVNYGLMIGTGLVLWIITETFFELPMWLQLTIILTPMVIVGVGAARLSKVIFLAFDLWVVPER